MPKKKMTKAQKRKRLTELHEGAREWFLAKHGFMAEDCLIGNERTEYLALSREENGWCFTCGEDVPYCPCPEYK